MKSEIRKILEQHLAKEQADHAQYKMLREILVKYHGKKLTRRIQHDLPDDYHYQVGIVGPEIIYKRNTDDQKRHFVCYNAQQAEFNIEQFDMSDAPYNRGALERIEKLESILNDDNKLTMVSNAFSKLKVAYKRLNEAVALVESEPNDSYHNPAFYELLRFIEVPSRLVSDVHFNKWES